MVPQLHCNEHYVLKHQDRADRQQIKYPNAKNCVSSSSCKRETKDCTYRCPGLRCSPQGNKIDSSAAIPLYADLPILFLCGIDPFLCWTPFNPSSFLCLFHPFVGQLVSARNTIDHAHVLEDHQLTSSFLLHLCFWPVVGSPRQGST